MLLLIIKTNGFVLLSEKTDFLDFFDFFTSRRMSSNKIETSLF